MDLSNDVVLDIKKENQEFLQFKKLQKYSDLISHCYSLGTVKNYRTFKANKEPLPKDEYEKNMNDYNLLCEANNLDYKNIVKASQAHTDNILNINSVEKNEIMDTTVRSDGLITNKKQIILATTNADCILLLMFDPIKKVIANVHSGWRGTLQEISVKTVEKMKKDYGCNPRDIIVCICPSIRKCHFEVDEDIAVKFYEKFKYLYNIDDIISKGKIKENKQKYNIDTVLINKTVLLNLGLQEKNIIDCDICTVCNSDKFHSYRVDKEASGRNTGIITLI